MRRRAALIALLAAAVVGPAVPAFADHTSPATPLSPVAPQFSPAEPAVTAGDGEWDFIANLGPMQGTDLEFFEKDGVTYVSAGTLGQGPSFAPGFVGQRIAQLTDGSGAVLAEPKVVADHGSARCNAPATSATGLQHDVQAVPLVDTELLVDTTDAVGRCHDTPGGGLELIDVSGLGTDGFEVRELALMRFNGLSHTVTADRDRPGILYNNGADFAPMTWTDVVDVRSCMGFTDETLEQRRSACKPLVYRLPFPPESSNKQLPDGTLAEPANCHDITYSDSRLYCAALNATLVFDVSGMFDPVTGDVLGEPLFGTAGAPQPCPTVAGTSTSALVFDCALKAKSAPAAANPNAAESVTAYEEAGRPAARGFEFLGTVNHPGRACPRPTETQCNTNLAVPSAEGVAISHEADPTPEGVGPDPATAAAGRYMMVTDERGGGVLPPGATCAPSLDNPVGNGGLHVFDISDPANPEYALTPEGDKAVYIGGSPTPSPTFCTIHVIEHVPGEQRIAVAYYDGGTKILDYFVSPDGAFTFKETASLRLPGANTWASEVFKVEDNGDGTNTYYFASSGFSLGQGLPRGIDVFSWTGPANAIGTPLPETGEAPNGGDGKDDDGTGGGTGGTGGTTTPVASGRTLPATGADLSLLLLALTLLPAAVGVRVLRRRLAEGPTA
ncbi:MAG TPA: hypothetical protein VM433_05630 [Mycobacteriales bacterium]|nr:hypothetical protein [Mycobacteriales bacterium]